MNNLRQRGPIVATPLIVLFMLLAFSPAGLFAAPSNGVATGTQASSQPVGIVRSYPPGGAGSPYAPSLQTDIPGPAGSGNFGGDITVLPNGNIVVVDTGYDEGGATDIGAVYLYDGATLSIISTLKGSTTNDLVGLGGATVLSNGNYVVVSVGWDNPTGPFVDAGAVTWCSATSGCDGVVSASNSLIGGSAGDFIGSRGVTVLSNGNYVVVSQVWDNPSGPATDAGAVTWGNGEGGTVGLVTSSNSLVGGRANDNVGGSDVIALTNGNYVVRSYSWDNPSGPLENAGAVTWGNGAGGTAGLVTPSNSLVGGSANDVVGFGGVVPLTNSNYVVVSQVWDNLLPAAADAGAVTWGNGDGGTVGLVSASNSLVGSSVSDQVGSHGVTALTNGNYVVGSAYWENPTGPVGNVGAATWGNGEGGTVGPVTPFNSLVGSSEDDYVGIAVTPLTNGNYVVGSYLWDNPSGPLENAGAATWGNGEGGTVGPVTSSNSLVGGTAGDQVGLRGVTALTNGNYVVRSYSWNNPTGPVADAGAATWGNGEGGTVGLVTPSNSLVGGTAGDNVGGTDVTALTNGNYVVRSHYWDNPTGPVADAGAATWGNGEGGTVGLVTSSNSLVGSTTYDQVGVGGVTALTNGNYVVASPDWDKPFSGVPNVGAATWGNGAGGTVGEISASNSLVGGTTNDNIGGHGVTALTNGNYVVRSERWDNPSGAVRNAGAATWGNGATGTAGLVTSFNSLVGGTTYDQVGYTDVTALANGDYVVWVSDWDNPSGGVPNAGAVALGNGTGGTVGPVSSDNSVLGAVRYDINNYSYDYVRSRLFVGRYGSNIVSILYFPTSPTSTPTIPGTPSATNTAAAVATATSTATACPIQFQDVPADSTFYSVVRCLACRNILSGYACGGEGEPCGASGNPYFRPSVQISRGQIAKIVAQSAGLNAAPGARIFEDVPEDSPFFPFIQRLTNEGYMGGYPCGQVNGEPCEAGNRPYFRPSSNATRGQLSKIVANAAQIDDAVAGQTYEDVPAESPFYLFIERLSALNVMSGYPCGSPGEPCGAGSKPYFRPNADVTRGQASKIVANTFFPNCQTPARK